MTNLPGLKNVFVEHLDAFWLHQKQVQLAVLRLDKIHPVVSGNKWFKLKYYLQHAQANGKQVIASFGGAYSNHIAALAFACCEAGLQCIGIIRGEKPKTLSPTLVLAASLGMQLEFVSRNDYNNKQACMLRYPFAYWVNEGGYGTLGAAGAAELLQHVPNLEAYTHIVCAVGTGTTLAGLVTAALPRQCIIGISVLKGNLALHEQVWNLLPANLQTRAFTLHHDYHFGGYAKHTPALFAFMNCAWQQFQLPTDFVYTAKAFYAVQDLIEKETIPAHSRVLFIHTGGLQGNLSLKEGTLQF